MRLGSQFECVLTLDVEGRWPKPAQNSKILFQGFDPEIEPKLRNSEFRALALRVRRSSNAYARTDYCTTTCTNTATITIFDTIFEFERF